MVTTENEVAPTPVSQPTTMTIQEQIKHDYDNGAYSPLQLSYKHNVEIADVLNAIGQGDMNEVTLTGDQIDDAGPGAVVIPFSKAKVTYTKN